MIRKVFNMNGTEIYSKINDTLIAERFFLYKRNLSKNISLIKQFGGLKHVIPVFENKTVIVAGAGPSLDAYYKILKEYSKRQDIVFIAADMAFRQMIKNGIVPDFVITCESTPGDFFLSEDVPEFERTKKKPVLLAFSCASNSNIRKWKGEVRFFNWMKKGPGFNELWSEAGTELGFVGTASIVTTQAISIALGCNIKQLIILGNDLGFAERYYGKYNDRYYGMFNNSSRLKPVCSTERILLEKIKSHEIHRNGAKFHTNNQFAAAKLWLDELFTKTEKTIYDGSIPGCSPDRVIKIMEIDLKKILSLKRN